MINITLIADTTTLPTSMSNETPSTISQSQQSFAPSHKDFNYKDFYTGLTLALLSSFFIGSSFILKKKGLLKLCSSSSLVTALNKNGLRAGQGGYGYLREWLWWSGLITMGIGELCNFAAYGFVPATLVTPLGALSVLISAVMSAYFLKEKLNTIGKIGCLLTAIGSTVMVIHAPKEGEVKTVSDLLTRLQDTEFISFTLLSIVTLVVLIVYMVPRYGNTNVLVYILICSILGSFTVMSCKGLSLGIKEILSGKPSVSYLYTYLFALVVIACIVTQMNYLNKSLDIFNTAIVTTVYYVLFTLFVMIASSLLFKELLNVSFQDFVGCLCGFSTIVCALCLIHFFKSTADVSASNITSGGKHFNNLVLENRSNPNDIFEDNYLATYEKNLEIINISNGSNAKRDLRDLTALNLELASAASNHQSCLSKNNINNNSHSDNNNKSNQYAEYSSVKNEHTQFNPPSILKSSPNSKSQMSTANFLKRLTSPKQLSLYKNMPKKYLEQLINGTTSLTSTKASSSSYNILKNDDDDDDEYNRNSKNNDIQDESDEDDNEYFNKVNANLGDAIIKFKNRSNKSVNKNVSFDDKYLSARRNDNDNDDDDDSDENNEPTSTSLIQFK